MSWLGRNFPSIFIDVPDGTIHFRFEGSCIVKSEDGLTRLYSFKHKKLFLLNEQVEGKVIQSTRTISSKLHDVVMDNANMEAKLYRKEEKIAYLEHLLQIIREEKDGMVLDVKDCFRKMLNLRSEIATFKTQIEEADKRVEEKNKEREELREWYNEEIEKREETIRSLRDIINKFREDVKKIALEVDEKNEEKVEKLRKELEMLDRDFVDVAKAMRIYRKDEDRPKRGFRIKMDD